MKHLTKLTALMTAAAIFAFLPSALVCGQSSRRGGGGGGHSSHGGGVHSSSSHVSSGSRSGSTYSYGGSHGSSSMSSSRSSGSYSSSRPSGGSQTRRSGGMSSGGSMSRPSGGSMSRPSGSMSRPSSAPSGHSGGSVGRSGGSVGHSSGSISHSGSSAGRSSGSRSGSSMGSQRRSGGYSDGVYGRSSTPSHSAMGDVRSSGARVPDASHSGGAVRRDHNSGSRTVTHSAPAHGGPTTLPSVSRSRAGGASGPSSRRGVEARRPMGGVAHERPAPGSRPYAAGHHGAGPGRIHVNPHPGAAPHRPGGPRVLRGTPVHFHRPGHHHYGHYLPAPPPRYEIRHYWGRDYYYWDNIWYRYYAGRYWVCRPPFGYAFTPLADAVYTACTFAYYFDRLHYYDVVNDNARTIQAQNETIAANNALIAQQNEAIASSAQAAQVAGDLANSLGLVQSYAAAGTEYYYNDGVFYIKGADGQYTVIVPPAGAIVETLPDDYEVVELGGQEYYKVDDTIYRMTVVEGKACFEVLGQLTS